MLLGRSSVAIPYSEGSAYLGVGRSDPAAIQEEEGDSDDSDSSKPGTADGIDVNGDFHVDNDTEAELQGMEPLPLDDRIFVSGDDRLRALTQ